MSNLKISQLPLLAVASGNEDLIVAVNNTNYRVKASALTGGVFEAPTTTLASLGLDQVDNTSDVNKPVSVATAAAIATKAPVVHTHLAADVTDLLDQVAAISHVHTTADLTDLSTLAAAVHVHSVTDVAGLAALLDAKADTTALVDLAPVVHVHELTDVTGLTALLDAKAGSNHVHLASEIVGLTDDLAAKAPVVHVHTTTDITGLTALLDAKADTTALVNLAPVVHTHVSTDLTDLAALIASIKASLVPEFTVVLFMTSSTSTMFNIIYSTTNGYSCASVESHYRYRVLGDVSWINDAYINFSNGTLEYNGQINSLTPSTEYELEVYLVDLNNPQLTVSSVQTFTTTA